MAEAEAATAIPVESETAPVAAIATAAVVAAAAAAALVGYVRPSKAATVLDGSRGMKVYLPASGRDAKRCIIDRAWVPVWLHCCDQAALSLLSVICHTPPLLAACCPLIQVQLFPSSVLGPADYEVTVYTADSRGAGTDGGAAIAFVGDAGRSEWVPLRGRGDGGFARGGVDTFLVSAADVNDLSHVQLRLTGTAEKGSLRTGEDAALRSDWNVARVEVLHQVRRECA